jgi:hypothetical protein
VSSGEAMRRAMPEALPVQQAVANRVYQHWLGQAARTGTGISSWQTAVS